MVFRFWGTSVFMSCIPPGFFHWQRDNDCLGASKVTVKDIDKIYWWKTTTKHTYMMTSWNGNIFRVTGHLCGEFTGALMFSLICIWINGWVNNREAGDLRRYRAHYDAIVMKRQLYAYVFGCTAHCWPRVMLVFSCGHVMWRFVRLVHFTYSMILKGFCLAMINQLIVYCTFVIMDTTPANSLPRENLFVQPA